MLLFMCCCSFIVYVGFKCWDTHTRGSFLSMLCCGNEQEARDDRMYRKMFICKQSELLVTVTGVFPVTKAHDDPGFKHLLKVQKKKGTHKFIHKKLFSQVDHRDLGGLTDTTMAMGPAKLHIRVSYIDSQQKSGFPYPSGSSPTARPGYNKK